MMQTGYVGVEDVTAVRTEVIRLQNFVFTGATDQVFGLRFEHGFSFQKPRLVINSLEERALAPRDIFRSLSIPNGGVCGTISPALHTSKCTGRG